MMQTRAIHRPFHNAVLIFTLTTLGTFWLFQGRLINHDTAWFLIAVERWVKGAELYHSIVETNPPLNFYYTLPAYALAELIGLSLSDAQYAITSIMVGAVLTWSSHIAIAEDHSSRRKVTFVVLLWAATALPALRHFAQRDHLLFLFMMPWAMGLVFDKNGAHGQGGALRGAFAALGICLKPHFLVFPIFVALALALRERNLRPLLSASNISIIAIGAAYVAFVGAIHPAYFLEVTPKAILTYGDFGAANSRVILSIGLLKVLFVALLLLECLRRKDLPTGIDVLIALYIAGVASYLFQWKGFGYHSLPIHSFGVVLCAFLILRGGTNSVVRSAVICLLVTLGLSVNSGFYRSLSAQQLIDQLKAGPAVNGITVLSSHVYVGPIVALELQSAWHNRYPHLWTVPAIANAKAETACNQTEAVCAELQVLAAETRANVLEDLQTGLPDAIVFDKKAGYFDEPGFSYEVFLRRSAAISDFFDGYTQRVSTDRFDILYR